MTQDRRSTFPFEQRLSEIIRESQQVLVVLLTDVFGELTVRSPRDVPSGSPRLRVGARVVDGDFVMQRVLVGPRELLDDVQHVRVRMTGIVDPRTLVEPDD